LNSEIKTIQIHKETDKKLNELLKKLNVKSKEMVILHLIKQAKAQNESYFGYLPELEPFKRDKIDRFS
jgi:hypothetical protein